ncbi:MAG: OB-fold domain-containing protein [Pseudomonadota bacterium]
MSGNSTAFHVPRCADCGRAHWYPRPFCPFCFSGRIEMQESPGLGSVYSFSVMNTQPPLVMAYVQLGEGPVMMTNLVDADPALIHIGMKVKVAWRNAADGTPMPFFTPA